MNASLVLLAVLMFAVTYPSRVLPFVVPGVDRLPRGVLAYLRLLGPAVLAALAVVNSVVTTDHHLHVGVIALSVLACVVLVAWRRNLLLGLVVAAGLAVVLRAIGLS